MTAYILQAAKEIEKTLNALFDKQNVKAFATIEPTKAPPGVYGKKVVAIITAPDYRFTGVNLAEAEWEIWLVTDSRSIEHAWETLENVLEVFREYYQVTVVKPATYQPANGQSLPALIANFETTHLFTD